jgi:peptidoglycan/LPS O-acetylase OafA/YrhL
MHINIESPLKHISLVNQAYVFVDFFFILSAFVLYLSYDRDNSTFKKLVFKRIKRLYPLHLFILLLFFIFELIKYFIIEKHFHLNTNAFHNETSISSFFVSLLLLDSFSLFPHNIWNAPAWSISAELYAYIFIVFFTFHDKLKNYIFSIMIILVCLFVFNRGTLDYGSNFGIIRCLYSYILVILFFRYKLIRIINPFSFCVSIALVIMYFLFYKYFTNFEFVLPIAFTFIIFFIYYKIPAYTYNKYLIKLADLSFEVYLIQALIIVFFSDIFILLKDKFHIYYNVDKTGLVIFNNVINSLFMTLLIVTIIIFSSFLVSNVLYKIKKLF